MLSHLDPTRTALATRAVSALALFPVPASAMDGTCDVVVNAVTWLFIDRDVPATDRRSGEGRPMAILSSA